MQAQNLRESPRTPHRSQSPYLPDSKATRQPFSPQAMQITLLAISLIVLVTGLVGAFLNFQAAIYLPLATGGGTVSALSCLDIALPENRATPQPEQLPAQPEPPEPPISPTKEKSAVRPPKTPSSATSGARVAQTPMDSDKKTPFRSASHARVAQTPLSPNESAPFRSPKTPSRPASSAAVDRTTSGTDSAVPPSSARSTDSSARRWTPPSATPPPQPIGERTARLARNPPLVFRSPATRATAWGKMVEGLIVSPATPDGVESGRLTPEVLASPAPSDSGSDTDRDYE